MHAAVPSSHVLMSVPLQGTLSVLLNSHTSPLTHATHSVLNLMCSLMQDVQVVGEDGSHRKHPLLRMSREHVLAGHLDCVDDGSLIFY